MRPPRHEQTIASTPHKSSPSSSQMHQTHASKSNNMTEKKWTSYPAHSRRTLNDDKGNRAFCKTDASPDSSSPYMKGCQTIEELI